MASNIISEILIRVGLQSTVSTDARGVESQVSSLGATFTKHSLAIGAAATAVGAAIVGLTDSARKMNASLSVTALSIGSTEAEMRDLALSVTNVTFPLSEVSSTFDLLARAGMTSKDEIAATATAFDTLGDSIGVPASQVTNILIPAFDAFKIDLKDAADYTDMFTHLQRNTTVELSDFSSMLKYIAPELGNMNMGMQDSIAVLEALADKGIVGSSATREFRTAITAADGDINLFYETLGLTADEVASYSSEISNAEGYTQKFADAANEQYGMVDKVKQKFSELTLSLGSALEPLDAVGGAMATLGPILMGLQPMMSIFSALQTGTVVPALVAHAVAAWAAIAPYLAIAAPIIAVIAVLYILEKKFGVVTKAVEIITGALGKLVDWLKSKFGGGTDEASKKTEGFGDKLLLLLGPIGAVIYAFKNWDKIKGVVSNAFSKVTGYLDKLADTFKNAGKKLIQALIDGIKSLITKPKELVKEALGGIRDLLPFSDAKEGPLSDLTEAGANILKTLVGGMEAEETSAEGDMRASLAKSLSVIDSALAETQARLDAAGGENPMLEAQLKMLLAQRAAISVQYEALQTEVVTRNENIASAMTAGVAKIVAEVSWLPEGIRVPLVSTLTELSTFTSGVSTETTTISEILANGAAAIVAGIGWLPDGIKKPLESTLSMLGTLAGRFEQAGRGLIQALLNGINALINKPYDTLKGALDRLKRLLPSSDAEEGPLSNLTASGEALMKAFSSGMAKAAVLPGVAFEKSMPSMPAATAQGAGASYAGDTFNIGPVTLGSDYDVEKLFNKLQEMQSQRRVQRGVRSVI